MKNKGIICIETEWQITKKDNCRELNTEPLLKFLEEHYGIPYIYRRTATRGELEYYLKQFHKKKYDRYSIFYFNFHGWTKEICLESGERISINELTDLADGLFANRFIHFSSCRTLLGSENILAEIKEKSGAKMITGYTKSVVADLSAIHDIALMQQLITKKQLSSITNTLKKMYGGLEDKLGFRII